jgi:hypothetical protein
MRGFSSRKFLTRDCKQETLTGQSDRHKVRVDFSGILGRHFGIGSQLRVEGEFLGVSFRGYPRTVLDQD